jgi:hypothetical protein
MCTVDTKGLSSTRHSLATYTVAVTLTVRHMQPPKMRRMPPEAYSLRAVSVNVVYVPRCRSPWRLNTARQSS